MIERLRAYGTAFLLTMALFSATPSADPLRRGAVAIVRVAERGRGQGKFDPREAVGTALVLTVPLACHGGTSDDAQGRVEAIGGN